MLEIHYQSFLSTDQWRTKQTSLETSFPQGLPCLGRTMLVGFNWENVKGGIFLHQEPGASVLFPCIDVSLESAEWLLTFMCLDFLQDPIQCLKHPELAKLPSCYVQGYYETCSRSLWALVPLVVVCRFVLKQHFAVAIFSEFGQIWGLHPGSFAVYGAKME